MAMMELTDNDVFDRDGNKPQNFNNVELLLNEANKNVIRKLYSEKKLDESFFKGIVAEVLSEINGNRDADKMLNENNLGYIINSLKVKHYDLLVERLKAL
jgi:hypothetical protein